MKTRTGLEPTSLNFNNYMSFCSNIHLNYINTFLRKTATTLGMDGAALKIITNLQIIKKLTSTMLTRCDAFNLWTQNLT